MSRCTSTVSLWLQHGSKELGRAFLFVVLLLLSQPAFAQTGQISGVATDQQGAVVADAQVHVTNLGTTRRIDVRTDSVGRYSVPSLQAGRYRVVIEARGFSTATSGVITLADGQAATHDAQLVLDTLQSNVTVVGQEGNSEAGYKPETAKSLGPLGDKNILDTPYSMSVMSHELIQNSIAGTPDQLYTMNPLIQFSRPAATWTFGAVVLRGMFTRFVLDDGTLSDSTETTDIEALDRVEVLNGATNFLYGASQPGGRANYVYKNPTHERINNITAGSYGGSTYFAHADLGGNIDRDGTLSYRLNALTQNGDLTKDGRQRRAFVRGAVEWRIPIDGMRLQGFYSYSDQQTAGNVVSWGKAANAIRPEAPAVDENWSQPWTEWNTDVAKIGTKFNYDISEALTIRAAYQHKTRKYGTQLTTANTINNDGTYTTSYGAGGPQTFTFNTASVYGDYSARILGRQNKLTLGYNAYHSLQEIEGVRLITNSTLGRTPLGTHAVFPEPVYTVVPGYAPTADINYVNYLIGDEVNVGKWTGLISGTYTAIDKFDYPSSDYRKNRLSPTGSLIFKPNERMSVYGTYAEALDVGGLAGTVFNSLPVTNAGQSQSPTVSEQVEAGVKANVGGLLLTSALFRQDRATSRYLDNGNNTYTYVTDGMGRYVGLELTAVGRLVPQFTVFGGITLMKAEVIKSNPATATSPSTVGFRPAGSAEAMAKLTVEYDLAGIRGLTLTGGAYYTGTSYNDTYEVDALPGYTLFNAGLRYATRGRRPVMLRLNATNLTNKGYWLYGNAASGQRSFALSISTKL